MNALEWYNNISESSILLGLSNKVKKSFSEKSAESNINMFDYVVDKDTFMEVLDYHGISYNEDVGDFPWIQIVYANSNLSINNRVHKVQIVFKKGYLNVSDSPFDRYIVEKARTDEEFRKYCIQKNRLEYVKFEKLQVLNLQE